MPNGDVTPYISLFSKMGDKGEGGVSKSMDGLILKYYIVFGLYVPQKESVGFCFQAMLQYNYLFC